jgi:hypothetical protein
MLRRSPAASLRTSKRRPLVIKRRSPAPLDKTQPTINFQNVRLKPDRLLNQQALIKRDNGDVHQAGTSDHPLHNHSQARIPLHHIVMR